FFVSRFLLNVSYCIQRARHLNYNRNGSHCCPPVRCRSNHCRAIRWASAICSEVIFSARPSRTIRGTSLPKRIEPDHAECRHGAEGEQKLGEPTPHCFFIIQTP